MHDAGVRGIRVNLYKYQAMHNMESQKIALSDHARALGGYYHRNRQDPDEKGHWSMAFTHTHPEFWAELTPTIITELVPIGVRLVTDHFALLKGASMLNPGTVVHEQSGYREILDLVRKGHLYVKLSAPYRVSSLAPGYEDLEPLVRAFVDANPWRVLWGSDWYGFLISLLLSPVPHANLSRPHTPHMRVRTHEEAMKETQYLVVDDLAWLMSLKSWLSSEEWHLMMVSNPKELYGW